MQLLDDHMFRLWRQGIVDEREILMRAISQDEMRTRIARAKKGLLEDEDQAKGRLDEGPPEEV
jgi:twitching motility protein PilT